MGTSINVGKRGLLAIFTCILASASLSVSCSKDDTEKTLSEETASLTVTLNGQAPRTKAVAPPEDADELEKAENTVKNATVFVFNANGTLDKRQTLAAPSLSATISGLLAGEKRVVVVANVPSSVTFPDGINYSWFADAGNVIDLDTQSPETNGLFMSGEDMVTLTANSTATKTISISRIAAKIKLGTVTISPDPGHDPDKFVLNKVIVMKARGSAMMGLPSAAYTPNVFYGGMAGDKSTVKAYLSETISTSDYSNRYFYVLPSDNDDGNTTLITLAGTYDGQPAYFPFRINDKVGTGEASSDGTFIRRNYVYTVNVKLKRLGGGSSNPEVPADPASLDITVEPQDWTAELVQDVEW
ncbi:fimbrial protein [Alistipes communis]|uniref:fimbrial protein n=1 Tax=Alistipes communis TaxID=2585118 RepID=UPI0009D9D298|nr:fimbrial protein [Alistipes communis]